MDIGLELYRLFLLFGDYWDDPETSLEEMLFYNMIFTSKPAPNQVGEWHTLLGKKFLEKRAKEPFLRKRRANLIEPERYNY